MIVIDTESVTLPTPSGPMRTHIVRPAAPGKYPGIVFYTEIFQVTGPIRRTAAMLAGHGYIVAIPKIYHEFEAAGTVLADGGPSDRTLVIANLFHRTERAAVLPWPGSPCGQTRFGPPGASETRDALPGSGLRGRAAGNW